MGFPGGLDVAYIVKKAVCPEVFEQHNSEMDLQSTETGKNGGRANT